ncbi:unnamed protein product, partial [Hymenolepis diminuta]
MRNGAETLPHFREMVDRNANKNDTHLPTTPDNNITKIRTNGETSDHRLLEFEQPLE